MKRRPDYLADDESAVVSRLRALIIPGTPDEQRRRRLVVLDGVRRGYVAQSGVEPQWLIDLGGRLERGEPLQRAKPPIRESSEQDRPRFIPAHGEDNHETKL